MFNSDLPFAYFSPETLLPVGSIIATVLGVVMMLGRGSLRFFIRSIKRVFRPSTWIAGVSRPHFRIHEQGEQEAADAGYATAGHGDATMRAMESGTRTQE
jgi:hypothetical protein